ncbi:DUF5924 family protein [Pigmentiphaga soli]|uniref:DUF5924 family protein n=1 Tax=Pigmentiphaga soli TaxID=1007095 RepID=A0ABP8GWT1_9BURK
MLKPGRIPPSWKHHFDRVLALVQRYPGVIAAFGFVSGIVSFFTVERHEAFARGIALIMIASWLWLVVENSVRQLVARRFGLNVPIPLLRYFTQMIHQEGLFFVLPFLYTSTTWLSGQAVFTGLAGACAVVALVDPLYNHWLSPRRWVFLAFHAFTLFTVLLTALPLVLRLPTGLSYELALGAAVLMSYPSVADLMTGLSRRRGYAMAAALLALGAVGWFVRHWVPPSTMWLAEEAITTRFDTQAMAPGEDRRVLTLDDLGADGLYAYTAISAPLGLRERVYHVWLHDGREQLRLPLDIQVGRKQGYRAWSHKQNFGADPAGRWEVRVMTEEGQMIGQMRFRVQAERGRPFVPVPPAPPPS